MTPVVVPLVAALLLDYQPHLSEHIGLLLVVTGILFAFFKPYQSRTLLALPAAFIIDGCAKPLD